MMTTQNTAARQIARMHEKSKFPPSPPDAKLLQKVAHDFCKAISPGKFEEGGCAVCGRLTPFTQLINISKIDYDFDILTTRKCRHHMNGKKVCILILSENTNVAHHDDGDFVFL